MPPERDLFANFERMRREIDELFGDVFGRAALAHHRRAGFIPPVDVSYAEGPPRVIVTAALPGVRIEELDLKILGRELHLSGQRRPAESEGRVYQQIEIEHGPFHRVIELGADVLADRTQAVFEEGMLRIELPLAPPRSSGPSVAITVARHEGPSQSARGARGADEHAPRTGDPR